MPFLQLPDILKTYGISLTKIKIRDTVFQLIAIARFLTMFIGKKLPMNSNKCHVNNELQTLDKVFDTKVKMIC